MALDDKVILISGATGSLGARLTRAFAATGARLALCARTFASLYELETALIADGGKAVAFPCDVRYEDEVIRLIHRVVERYRRIDCLINAAAVIGPKQPVVDYPLDPWRDVISTNLTGTFLMCREVLPWMLRQQSGSIINVTSSAALASKSGGGAFMASKCAVEGMTRMLADETRGTGVRVNMIDVGQPRSDRRTLETSPEVTPPFLWLADDASARTSGRRIVAAEFSPPSAG